MRKYIKCIVNDCSSMGHKIKGVEYFTKGYCQKHYLRLMRYDDIGVTKSTKGENRLKNPLYRVYQHMLGRCITPTDKGYRHYGGRGITVCERWLEPNGQGFRNFLKDMGERPEGCSIDRIDVNGNYESSNCRWADYITQANNKTTHSYITARGVTRTTSEWSKITGINRKLLWERVKRGDVGERALRLVKN